MYYTALYFSTMLHVSHTKSREFTQYLHVDMITVKCITCTIVLQYLEVQLTIISSIMIGRQCSRCVLHVHVHVHYSVYNVHVHEYVQYSS